MTVNLVRALSLCSAITTQIGTRIHHFIPVCLASKAVDSLNILCSLFRRFDSPKARIANEPTTIGVVRESRQFI